MDVSYGLGEAVGRGIVSPDNHLFDKVTYEEVAFTLGSKKVMAVYRQNGAAIKQSQCPNNGAIVPAPRTVN